METRTLPIQTLEEFFQLLKITPPQEKLKLFSTYSKILKDFINSIDDIFRLFAQVDSNLKKEIIETHPNLFQGAFKKVEDILVFKQRDKDHDFYRLTKDSPNQFTKHLISLFTQPSQVLMLIENADEEAEKIFSYEVPCAVDLVFSKKNYQRLSACSMQIVINAIYRALDMMSKKQHLTLEDFFNLAEAYQNLPVRRSYYSYDSKPKSQTQEGEHFLNGFKQLLNTEQHRETVTLLSDFPNFIRLYDVSVDCANVLLQFRSLMDIVFKGKINLFKLSYILENCWLLSREVIDKYPAEIAALFQTVDDVRKFCVDGQHASLISSLPDKYVKKIADIFVQSANLEDWLWMATEVARCNPDPRSFSLPRLAAAALEEYPFSDEEEETSNNRMLIIFADVSNLIRLTEICPGFAKNVIKKLNNSYKRAEEEGVETEKLMELFAKPEVFWQFLQAGGTSWLLSDFSLNVCAHYLDHIPFIFEKSQYFSKLDASFASSLLSPPSFGWNTMRQHIIWQKVIALLESTDNTTFVLQNYPKLFDSYEYRENPSKLFDFVKTGDDLIALVKTANFALAKKSEYSSSALENKTLEKYIKSSSCRLPDKLSAFAEPGVVLVRLAEAHPLLVNMLIENHPQKMLEILNLQAFMQLSFSQRFAFAERSPKKVAALFVNEKVELKDLLKILKDAQFNYSSYGWMHKPFCEIIKLQPEVFAKSFVAGREEDKVTAIKTYPIFTDLLFEIAPDIMASAFCGPAFVSLLKIVPVTASKLLNQLKDKLINLIPTQDDLIAVNNENSMLMKQFALAWPDFAALHLSALKATLPPISLPTIAAHKSIFLVKTSSPLIKVRDMKRDVSDKEMAASVFGQGKKK